MEFSSSISLLYSCCFKGGYVSYQVRSHWYFVDTKSMIVLPVHFCIMD